MAKPTPMNSIVIVITFLLCIVVDLTHAQVHKREFNTISYKRNLTPAQRLRNVVIVPTILVSAGLVAYSNNELLSNTEIREEKMERQPNFHTHVDDYLQYAPIAAVYGLNAAGVKGKNNFGNRTALLIKSELIMTTITCSLKKIVGEPRPDSGALNSFPSGHTAQAFAAAAFMAKEFGYKSIWYSVGAYSIATSVGVLRVMNDRHWASDVLAGAGIGILSTEIAYLTHQYKWGGKKNRAILFPSYSSKSGGVYFRYTLR